MDEFKMHADQLQEVFKKLDMEVKKADRYDYRRVLLTVEELDDLRGKVAQAFCFLKKHEMNGA